MISISLWYAFAWVPRQKYVKYYKKQKFGTTPAEILKPNTQSIDSTCDIFDRPHWNIMHLHSPCLNIKNMYLLIAWKKEIFPCGPTCLLAAQYCLSQKKQKACSCTFTHDVAAHSHASFSKAHQAQHWAPINSVIYSVLSSGPTVPYSAYTHTESCLHLFSAIHTQPYPTGFSTIWFQQDHPPSLYQLPLVVTWVASAHRECCP